MIAIGSAETYRALQIRTGDLQESLEYQTATSDVLKVISRSTFDLQPVLDTLVGRAARLCNADQGVIFRIEAGFSLLVANFGFPPEYEAYAKATGKFQLDPGRPIVTDRVAFEGHPVHIHDVSVVPGYSDMAIRLGRQRTSLGVPLLSHGAVIGVIVLARQRVQPFTERQIELVSTFADQAVIAIENTRLLTEQQEALEQQIATTEVLQVINASPGDLAPVFDAIFEKAMRLCGVAFGILRTWDGKFRHTVAVRGLPPAMAEYGAKNGTTSMPSPAVLQVLETKRSNQVPDLMADDGYRNGHPDSQAILDLGGVRACLFVPLVKDEVAIGYIAFYRREGLAFSDKDISLLENFAAQAVIAMENARLLTETQEALEQQTATAEVLQVINASPGNLAPVFDSILEKAHNLCSAPLGSLVLRDGGQLRAVATRGYPHEYETLARQGFSPTGPFGLLLCGEPFVHVPDTATRPAVPHEGDPMLRAAVGIAGIRTALFVPLRKDTTVLGYISAQRQEVRLFTDKQIALLQNFAAQAVVAMENARLLNEVRQRQEELRITFENMGDGVAMFDDTQHLVAWNRKFQDILDVPDEIIAQRPTFSDYVRYLADRGEYGLGGDVEGQVRRLLESAGQLRVLERVRPNGRVIEVRSNPVAGGGFVLIYADITERKRNEEALRTARDVSETALRELKTAQANLIQAEKMASLGQLTAGIAHEIKNPLNFVNNFAELSVDLLGELREAIAPAEAALNADQRDDVDGVVATLTSNLAKISEHGKRADGIVKAMLEHSRGTSGERRTVDINALADEALNLAYHGARAEDQSFNITLARDFGEGIAPIEVNPQDMTRVFLNLFSNGFYAANMRARNDASPDSRPTLKVTTQETGDGVEIRVRDNGIGIPADIRDKLFQLFFTTKPSGQGTGLGLSITYDIITKAHGGTI